MKSPLALVFSLLAVLIAILACSQAAVQAKAAGDITLLPGERIIFDDGTGCGPTLSLDGVDLRLQNTCTGTVSSLYISPSPNPPAGQRTRLVFGAIANRSCTNEYEMFMEGSKRFVATFWQYNVEPGCTLTGEDLELWSQFGPAGTQGARWREITWHAGESYPIVRQKTPQVYRVDRSNVVPMLQFENLHSANTAGVGFQFRSDTGLSTPWQGYKVERGTVSEFYTLCNGSQDCLQQRLPSP